MKQRINTFINYFIALVWLVNGLFCKILGMVPRHQEIVARILGESHAELLTKSIGMLEIGMAIWVLSNLYPKLNARIQISTIIIMNIIELICASDLLLWGRLNILFAVMFSVLIYKNNLGNDTKP